MTDINNDDFDFQSATIKAKNVDALLKDYENKGGSSNFSLKNLRSHVAKIIPFSDPNFIYHWSEIARRAIMSDIAANGPSASIGGTPPASLTVNEDSPVFIFPPSKGKNIESKRQSPLPESPLPPLPSFPSSNPIRRFPAPAFGVSSIFGSSQQHGSNPTGSSTALPSFSNSFNNIPREISSSPFQNPKTKSQKRVHIFEPFNNSSSHPLSGNVDTENNYSKHHKRSKHSMVSHNPDNDSSSSKSDGSSSGSDPEWAFKHGNESSNRELYKPSPSSIRLSKGIKSYRHKSSQAAESFIHSGLKPSDFPASLVPDLLKGKYIELKKIKGELVSRSSGDRQTMSIGSNSKGVKISSKISSAVINDQGE